MRTRLLCTTGLVAAVAALASVAPAFTADNASLTVTVTAQLPPAPCIEFLTTPGTNVRFGTVAFSRETLRATAGGDVEPRFHNCGTAAENIALSGSSEARSPLTTWTLGGIDCSPTGPRNRYSLFWGIDGGGLLGFMTSTPN